MADLINLPRAAWKRQPSGRLKLNLVHPLARNLRAFYVFTESQNFLRNLVNDVPTEVFNGVPLLSNTSVGMGLHFNASGTGIYLLNNEWCSLITRLDGCVVVGGYPMSPFRGANIFNMAKGTAPTNRRLIRHTGTNAQYGWNTSATSLTGPAWELGSYGTIALQWGGGNWSGVFNGEVLNTTSNTQSADPDNASIACNSPAPTITSLQCNFLYIWLGIWSVALSANAHLELHVNPWQLFIPAPSRFYLIPSSGATTQTITVSVDALIQRAGLTHSTSIDALLQSAFSRSLSIDGLIAAVQTGVIGLDALLQIVGTRTLSVDALLQAAKTGVVSVDALVQMTLTQAISLDALITAASASSASTDLDALIQALKTAGISLDALLSQSKTATAVIDALIQASKAGTVSLDAIITGASSTTVFVGLDALIQAIQAKTISLDALLQKSYTSPLALDAYVALTQVKTMSLDALLQSMKSGVISLDAILQMTKTAMVSFDALIQAAKAGVISLDAILVFATQASVLLDAYVQRTLARGVGLDAIIGSIADMILPTGRVITVPASDRFVFVTHSDRVIQIQ